MKKTLFTFILSCLFSVTFNAQSKKDIDKQLKDAGYSLDFVNDEKGLKAILQAKKAAARIGYKEGVLKSGHMLTVFYMRKDDYKKVIETTYETEPLALELENYITLSDLYRMRALSHGQLGLSELSYTEFQTAIKYTKKIKKKNVLHYKSALTYGNMIIHFDAMNDHNSQDSILYYLKKSLGEIEKIEDHNPDVKFNDKYDQLAGINSNLGMFYINQHEPQRIDLAEEYFLNAIAIYNNKKYKLMGVNRVLLSNSFGRFYYTKKDYNEAIKYATAALELEKNATSPYMRLESFEMLANSYLEINNKGLSKKYMKMYTNISDSIRAAEAANIEAPVNRILSQEKEKHTTILIFAGSISIILLLAGWLFWKRKNIKLQKDYEKLIEKLRSEKLPVPEMADVVKITDVHNDATERPLNITDSTVNLLLQKLEEFENSDQYIKNEVNLTYLANYTGTNTKSLSEIIKQYKGKSFNSYINGLRIGYIVKLLYKEPKLREYKISYLGELCGFSSREVFTVIFKKETGIPPSFFIDNLKKEADARQADENMINS